MTDEQLTLLGSVVTLTGLFVFLLWLVDYVKDRVRKTREEE